MINNTPPSSSQNAPLKGLTTLDRLIEMAPDVPRSHHQSPETQQFTQPYLPATPPSSSHFGAGHNGRGSKD